MAEMTEKSSLLRELELELTLLLMEIHDEYWKPPTMDPPPGHKLNKINRIEEKIKELKEELKKN